MLFTASQTYRGHSGESSPLIHGGQCRRGSLETREAVSSSLSRDKSVTPHASTPPGSWTRVAGPRARIRAASPWMSRPVGSRTKGPSCAVFSTRGLQARVGDTYGLGDTGEVSAPTLATHRPAANWRRRYE